MYILNLVFKAQRVNLVISCVKTEIAFLQTGYVIGYQTALMVQMKTKLRVPRAPLSFSVQMDGVWTWKKFVMERTTAVITATKIKSV